MRFWLFYKHHSCIYENTARTIIKEPLGSGIASQMEGAVRVYWSVGLPPDIIKPMKVRRRL